MSDDLVSRARAEADRLREHGSPNARREADLLGELADRVEKLEREAKTRAPPKDMDWHLEPDEVKP